MVLTSNQTGIVIAAISGVVIIVVIISALLFGRNLPFTFSCRNSVSQTDIEMHRISTHAESVDGEYEQYGELFVAPNKQPTHVALDIVTRIAMAHGLPGPDGPTSRTDSVHGDVPRVFLELPAPSHHSTVEDETVNACSDSANSTEATSAQYAVLERLREATAQAKAERIRSGDWSEVAKDEVSKVSEEEAPSSFGRGQDMAQMYR